MAEAVAVRHLVEAVRRHLRADPYRLEEHVVVTHAAILAALRPRGR
jgi:hypothetical protein